MSMQAMYDNCNAIGEKCQDNRSRDVLKCSMCRTLFVDIKNLWFLVLSFPLGDG